MNQTNQNAQRMLRIVERMRPLVSAAAIEQIRAKQLSPSHFRILGALWHTSPLAMKDVAGFLGFAPPSVTSLIRHLVRQGLVTRRPSADDSRIALLELTDEGQAMHANLNDAHVQRFEELLSALSAEEQETMLGLLERAVNTLSRPEDCARNS